MLAVADQQILRGVAGTLRWQNLDGDGSPAAPAGAVTVGVVDSAGATVLAAGTATAGADADPRTVALTPAQNATLDLLTATWTDTGDGSTHQTTIEVVGGYLFSLVEVRGSGDRDLADDQKWPDADVLAARRQIEEEFEEICDVAFVPRFRVDRLQGHGGCSLMLDKPAIRTVRSVTAYSGDTPTAWTPGDLAALEFDGATIRSRAGKSFPCGTVVVGYEHGYDRPHQEIKRAGFQRLRYLLSQPRTGIPDRATSFSVIDGGSYRLDVAGKWKTGQPDVDAVLQRWSERIPGTA